MHRLRIRVFVFVVGLLAAVLTAVLLLAQRAAYQHARDQRIGIVAAEIGELLHALDSERVNLARLAHALAFDIGVHRYDRPQPQLTEALGILQGRAMVSALVALDSAGQVLARAPSEPDWATANWPAFDDSGVVVLGDAVWLLHRERLADADAAGADSLVLATRIDDAWLAPLASDRSMAVTLLISNGPGFRVLASSESGASRQALTTWRPNAPQPMTGDQVWASAPLPVAEGELHLLVNHSLGAALADHRLLQWQFLAIGLAALLAAVLGALWIGNSISRPLGAMVRHMRRVGAGDFSAPAVIERRGEVGALAREFAFMLSSLAQREDSIRHLAFHDSLTGLPNRNRFNQLIEEALSERDARFAVLVMDIDRFREINDTLGHLAGDRVLYSVAQRLQHLRREFDVIARLSGDEFGVLLRQVDLADIRELAQRYREPFNDPVSTDGIALDVSASLGIAISPEHGETAGLLLQRAEVALYLGKGKRQPITLYSPEIDRHSLLRLTLMAELRAAIERNQLELYVQPKLDIRAWRIVGVECLVRWVHPEHGFVPPDEFIPLAEQTGTIRQLTAWMVVAATEWTRRWHEAGLQLKVAVNLSTIDLLDGHFPTRVAALLAEHRLPADALIFEVTESAVMEDPDAAIPVLTQLRELGVGLSIDDFGTGYSSMAQLKRLPVDELKIDKSFVFDVADNPDDAVIVRSTIELAHNMELRVVAEGVETERSLNWLARFGCDLAQGYFLSRPIPAKDLEAWIETSPYLAAGRDSGVTPPNDNERQIEL